MSKIVTLNNLSDDFIANENTQEISIDWGRQSSRKIFTVDGEVTQPIKEFIARVTATDGKWSIDYSSVGFTKILSVQATGISSGTALADKRFISINQDQPTLTSCSGSMSSSSSAGLLAAMTMVNGDGDLYLHIVGI